MASQRLAESSATDENVPEMLPGFNSSDYEAVWHYIENGLDRIMFEPTWGTDISSLIGLYTAVHNFCTSQKAVQPEATQKNLSHRGAHLLGEELYRSFENYLHQYLGGLKQRLKSISGQILLDRYLNECAHYANAAQIINHVFRYLNRHWVKRELDEGKKSIYDIYTLHIVLWQSEIFREISHLLVDAVSELVDKHRTGDIMNVGMCKAFIEFVVLLEPDGMDLYGSVRDVYGNLLETPWRIALKASDYMDLPEFLYKTPVTASVRIKGMTPTEMEERLVSLVLHSGFKRPFTDGDLDAGTVKLVTSNQVVIEIDQSTAECSFLIKRLCAYFGRVIIARELIPIPNVGEQVLRKVLLWCEYHKNDADTRSDSDGRYRVGRYRRSDVDEWDQKYFQVDQEMLFEIILAANYLDIEPLLDTGCKTVANLMKGKSPEEIRTTFNIKNDFTPEEEDQIRLENEWAEDTDRRIDQW